MRGCKLAVLYRTGKKEKKMEQLLIAFGAGMLVGGGLAIAGVILGRM